MTGTRIKERRSRRRDKVLAIAAAGVVLAAGITVPSLAAWTDIEWVTGGVDTENPGVSSGSFEVQQLTEGQTLWGDYETQGSPNVISFGSLAAALTPGDTVYGWVQLRTVAGSLGGSLTLGADTTVVADTLSEALRYGAAIVADENACTAGGFAAGTVLQAAGSALNVPTASTAFSLDAAPDAVTPGDEVTVCFQLNIPTSYADDEDIQGDTVDPLWHFDAVSVAS